MCCVADFCKSAKILFCTKSSASMHFAKTPSRRGSAVTENRLIPGRRRRARKPSAAAVPRASPALQPSCLTALAAPPCSDS
eukprot:COSAG06_NODE_61694_length_267_cov_0.601190_1_plen_80_part_01